MIDKRKSPDYQELRGFIPKTLSMQFKVVCKAVGTNINDGIEEAVREWIARQEKFPEKKQPDKFISVFQPMLPTISTAIKETLDNETWGLKHLAADTKISVDRLKKLRAGDRATDEEIKQLAGYLITFNGQALEEDELADMRLAEDLQQRQKRRDLERQEWERRNKNTKKR